MKVDHFAEFRRSHVENKGNVGNRGTRPEERRETEEFSTGMVVPHDLEGLGTREQAMDPEANTELSTLFPVPRAITKAGNSHVTPKGEAKQRVCETVPHVPHVPRKNKERGEEVYAREV